MEVINNRYKLIQIDFDVNTLICCLKNNFVHLFSFLRTCSATFVYCRIASPPDAKGFII